MRRWILHVAGGVAVLLIVSGILYLVGGSRESEHQPSAETAPVYAPDFTFPDASGKDVVLSTVNARVRIVHFWASWSPYSRTELPVLARVNAEYGDEVEVIALDRDTNPAEGKAFLASLGLGDNMLFAYDSNDTYFKEVGGYNMPETLFVSPDGEVVAHMHGPMGEEALRAELDTLLNDTSL